MNTKLESISSNNLRETEEYLKRKQQENVDKINKQKQQIKDKISHLSERISDMDELKLKAEEEISEKETNFKGRLNAFLGKKEEYKSKLEQTILPKYFDLNKYTELTNQKEKLLNELNDLTLPNATENIVIFCENKNAELLNNSGLNNVSFVPEKNSNGVFVQVRANPDKFGLRDRDFLVDEEISRLKKKFPNYFILEYYCFENYLFHPNNLEELNLDNFDINAYKAEIINQKQKKKEEIISIYKKARDSYQEFKIDSDKIKSTKDNEIIENLNSDDVEVFFKSFSMKDYFDKSCLAKYNLNESTLSSTNWFKVKF